MRRRAVAGLLRRPCWPCEAVAVRFELLADPAKNVHMLFATLLLIRERASKSWRIAGEGLAAEAQPWLK